MSPVSLLLCLVGLTVVAWLVSNHLRHLRRKRLRALAARWRMQYVPDDLFGLSGRLAGVFPVAGAADVVVRDVIYGVEGDWHRWIFAVQYTQGVVRGQRRVLRVAALSEPRESQSTPADAGALRLGAVELSLIEQYEALHDPPAQRDQADASS